MRRKVRIATVGVVAVLVLTACGSHSSSTTTSSSPAAAGGSSTAAAGASSSAASSAGSFGTLGEVCGPGSATGATDVGVSATSIRVGTIADVGWSVAPGLLQPIFDAATTFVDWCNAAGGINGRKLDLDERDSAYSNYLPQVKAACPTDIALVGSMGVLDDTGVDQWVSCGMPNFTAATVGEKAANAQLAYPTNPLPADQENIGGFHWFFSQDPTLKSAVGSLYSNGAAGDREQHTYNEAIEAIGGKVVYTAEYTQTTTNWAPYVQAMKAAGVKFLFLNDSPTTSVGLEAAMATAGWYPKVTISPPNWYDSNAISIVKNPVNYYTYIPTTPFEAAASVPAVQQLSTLLAQYAPKADKTFFAETAFSGWLLFAEGVKSCGSNVTRTCIENYVKTQTTWTGGGLEGQINPAANIATNCYIVMKVQNGGFVQAYPTQQGQYDCDPQNAPVIKP
jgi:ABC-type branched-subunit amino acid transport system substrate-binding protein